MATVFRRSTPRSAYYRAEPLFEGLESRVLLSTVVVTTGADAAVNGNNLQNAINAALPGDTLVLQAGATYQKNVNLPWKNGNSTITIQSSALASLPGGVRVGPAQAGLMPKIVTASNNVPAVATEAANASHGAAHDYTFLGVEFGPATQPVTIGELISLGGGGTAQDTLAEVPARFTFDRCYVHGSVNNVSDKRGIGLNSSDTTISNSYLSEWHSNSQDSQAICGWNGPGLFTIVNNYIEGAGENVMFGGAFASIPNLVPSNIVVRGNHFSKPLSWNHNDPATYAGTYYVVKNIFELKNAQNVTVDKNLFENNWSGGQSGMAIVFTPRGEGSTMPWATVNNVIFTNNIVQHSGGGVNMISSDDGGNISGTANHITIRNNLFFDIGAAKYGGTNYVLQFLKGTSASSDLTVEHNTIFTTKGFMSLDSGGTIQKIFSNFNFSNNIVQKGTYGIHGPNGEGKVALDAFFTAPYIFLKNVITGANANIYPVNNYFPANDGLVGFTNQAAGNYMLAPGSTYKGQATDGTDPGINYPVVVSINRVNPSPTNLGSVNFTVTFNKPVTGVDSTDFALVKAGIGGGSITSVTGSGATYNVLVNAGTGDGTLGLNLVDDDTILDVNLAPLGFLGAANGNFTGQVYTIDRTAPIVALLAPAANAFIQGTTVPISGTAGRVSGDSTSVTVKIYAGATATGSPVQTLVGSVNQSTGGFAVSSTGLPQGRYTVQVTQTDSAGNTGTSSAVTYYTYNTLAGDANGDGTVNFADFTVLSNNMGATSSQGPAAGDFNYDGVTNFADFTILSNNFGNTASLQAAVVASADMTTAIAPAKKNKSHQKVDGADVLAVR